MKKIKKVAWYIIKYTTAVAILCWFSIISLLEKYDDIMSMCLLLFITALCIINIIMSYDDIRKERKSKLHQVKQERKLIKEIYNAESRL